MTLVEKCKLAARVRTDNEIKEAFERYYQNPKICAYCGEIIRIAPGEKACYTKTKKYCNSKCMGKANAIKYKEDRAERKILNTLSTRQRREEKSLAQLERDEAYLKRSKEDCLNSAATRVAGRIRICKHAHRRYSKLVGKSKCFVCGYDKYTEVCHKKSVSSFPGSATLDEINSLDNLISLCPNCHWEFDNGHLKL